MGSEMCIRDRIVLVAMGLAIVAVVAILLFAARLHASGDSPWWWVTFG